MNSLERLQQRKAELSAKLDVQRVEIKQTLLEIRAEVEPANLLKKAVKGVFSPSEGKTSGATGVLTQGVSFLLDLLVKDPRLSVILKLLTPMALKYLPQGASPEEKVEKDLEKALKPNFYGKLRQGVSSLRSKLKNKDTTDTSSLNQTEH